MFNRSMAISMFILMSTLVLQGCSGDSGSSNPAGPGDDDESGWSTELVKSGNFANGEINVAIDANGKLYISAYDFNTGLQFITNRSGSWVSTLIAEDDGNSAGVQNDIAVDGNGKVHTVYSSYDGISTATDESGAWTSEDMWMEGGGSCCIVSDSDGDIHCAFDDGSYSDIRYACKPSGAAWEGSIILADEWINSDCDIDFDSSDNPHVIFNFAGHHNLRYAFITGSWNVFTLEGSDSYPYEPDTGWTPAIAVNKISDAANIVFWNSTDNTLQYSDGSANSAVTLKSVAGWTRPCIALDSGGYAHVFFGEYGTNILNYATNKSGSWVNTALSTEIGGNELAVAIDAGDKIHVIYANKTDYDLCHAGFQLE
ncbi:MAG: hypothetical protein JW814_09540 [Candidatus Krumholzibacteriota bacterium]|nr:hypothetical protein [Candidatus Krumholzibacteriota bacterium]